MNRMLLGLTIGLAFVLATTSEASAIQFLFHQGGFEEGSYVSGSFSGEDLNGNGVISYAEVEVSSFGGFFSGSSQIPPVPFSIAFGFDFDLSTSNFRVIRAESLSGFSTINAWSANGNFGEILQRTGSNAHATTTTEAVSVTRVPEAGGTLSLMLGGICGLGALARRFRKS